MGTQIVPTGSRLKESGKDALYGSLAGVGVGLLARIFGLPGELLGGAVIGAMIGGSRGEIITINATMDATAAMMLASGGE